MFSTSLDLQSVPQGPTFKSQSLKSRIPTPLPAHELFMDVQPCRVIEQYGRQGRNQWIRDNW